MYNIWRNMLARCNNAKAPNYADYGGRGIKVCKRWQGEHGFERFLQDVGERPKGTSLERRKNNLGYTPTNCYWATKEVQANNTRRNVYITFRGEKLSIAQLSRIVGLSWPATKDRVVKHNWDADKAFKPKGKK